MLSTSPTSTSWRRRYFLIRPSENIKYLDSALGQQAEPRASSQTWTRAKWVIKWSYGRIRNISSWKQMHCCRVSRFLLLKQSKKSNGTYPPEYMQQCSPYPQSRLEFTWSIPTQRTMHSLRRAMAETMYVRPRSDRKYADSADIKVPHTKKGKTAWRQQLLSEWKTLAATTTQRGENLGRNNYSARGKPWHPLARALTRS